jgi:hypothetical protein
MLVEVTASVILAAAVQRYGAGESTFAITSDKSRSVIACGRVESSMLQGKSVEKALAEYLAMVPEVERIFVERADGNLLVWLTSDRPSREVRERIFKTQFDLIDAFPEVSFDFNIISTRPGTPSENVSEAKLVYSR